MPPLHPFLQGLRPTLLIAHRGGAALWPENTLFAFRQAVTRYGAQVLELDVHLSSDGEVVVFHDATLERCTDGEGPLAERSFGELARLDAGYRFTPDGGESFPFRGLGLRIPTFAEVLEDFPGLRLNVDLKAHEGPLPAAFAKLVRRHDAAGLVCCGSDDDEAADRVHRALPEACHFYPANALAEFVIAARNGEEPPSDECFSVLDMPLHFGGERLINPALLEGAARAGKWVNVWTIDDPAEMRRLVAEGVGGIMTDRPDLLRAVLG